MNPIKFYLDEDVDVRLAVALRRYGFDAITTREAKKLNTSDSEQLEYAIHIESVIVSANVSDYARLHDQYQKQKKRHCGIIVTKQIPVGEALRRLSNLTSKLSADDMVNRLEYLGTWR